MTEIAVIALAVAIAGAIGVIVYLARADVADAHAQGDVRVAQTATEAHLSESNFKAAQLSSALALETARANALEEQLTHELSSPFPDAPHLDPADVRGRMLQLAKQWGAAAAGHVAAVNAGALAEPAEAVPQPAAAGSTGAAAVPAVAGKLPG